MVLGPVIMRDLGGWQNIFPPGTSGKPYEAMQAEPTWFRIVCGQLTWLLRRRSSSPFGLTRVVTP